MFIALLVGPALASAKWNAALPLLRSCPAVVVGWIGGGPFPTDAMVVCGVGGIIALAIPGTIGIWLMVFRSAQ